MKRSYPFFSYLINNKKVLYIPIVSCINRDTQEYDLGADGNVNRFITTFSLCNEFHSLDIVLPKKHVAGSENILEMFKTSKINFVWAENFGIHAGEQRRDNKVIDSVYELTKDIEFDVCIFESQGLGLKLMDKYKGQGKMFMFWNPVSATETKTRIFLEGYEEINKQVCELCDYMIVASPDQIKYYSSREYSKYKLIYLDKLIYRNLTCFSYEVDNELVEKYKGKTIYYLPFRLTDEGYKFDKVLEYLEKQDGDFVVLYSDPNNSHVVEKLDSKIKEKFDKVSSNRNTYYTILDHIPCTILYFEDLEFINHAAIHEFMSDKCKSKVILYKQDNNPYDVFSCDRITNINF